MRDEYAHAVFGYVRRARAKQKQALAAVVVVQLVALVYLVAERIRLVARFSAISLFRQPLRVGLPLSRMFVSLAVFGNAFELRFVRNSIDIFLFVCKFHRFTSNLYYITFLS